MQNAQSKQAIEKASEVKALSWLPRLSLMLLSLSERSKRTSARTASSFMQLFLVPARSAEGYVKRASCLNAPLYRDNGREYCAAFYSSEAAMEENLHDRGDFSDKLIGWNRLAVCEHVLLRNLAGLRYQHPRVRSHPCTCEVRTFAAPQGQRVSPPTRGLLLALAPACTLQSACRKKSSALAAGRAQHDARIKTGGGSHPSRPCQRACRSLRSS